MNKLETFLTKYGMLIIIFMTLLVYSKSCGIDSEVSRIKKEMKVLESIATKKDLQIEGLRVEKRMIQSTDRKLLDVNRQSEIDRELQKIDAK
jgi:hypothetical protein